MGKNERPLAFGLCVFTCEGLKIKVIKIIIKGYIFEKNSVSFKKNLTYFNFFCHIVPPPPEITILYLSFYTK